VIRLYRAPFSTNVERVALALAHKGLEVESVWIDYADRSPVERVSGQPLVPILEFDDGSVVYDSMQIVRVLEERFRDRPLYPADAAGRARLIHFIGWFDEVWKLAPNAIEAEIGRDVPDVARIDALAQELAAALDRFEAMLDGRYPFLKYALWRHPDDDELFHRVLDGYQQLGDDHPRLEAWIRRVDVRPRV
jgi:glutathione S-transferase